jgi:hypothetical protein
MEGYDLAKKSLFGNIKGWNVDNKEKIIKKEDLKQKKKKDIHHKR